MGTLIPNDHMEEKWDSFTREELLAFRDKMADTKRAVPFSHPSVPLSGSGE